MTNILFSTLYRYEAHYALPLGRKKGAKLTDAEEAVLNKKRSAKCDKKYKERQKDAKVEQGLTDQFMTGKMTINSVETSSDLSYPRSCVGFHLLPPRTVRKIRRICAGGQGARILLEEDQGQEGKINC